MFLTGYDGWSLPLQYREVARVAKPSATQSVVALVHKLISPGQEAA